MCGLTGFIDLSKRLLNKDIVLMNKAISHRGPDASNIYFTSNDRFNVGLGHQRLSIIDISDNANQPINFKQFSIVFNGEIYNYKSIRNELIELGYTFQTSSDTEVVIISFAHWGESCIDKFHGMWAFVIYDKIEEKIFLCRDRIGVKPMFYYKTENTFAFCSEIKGLKRIITKELTICKSALSNYFNFGYISQDECIYNEIHKVKAGSWLIISASLESEEKIYWDATNEVDNDYADNIACMSKKQLLNHSKSVLTKAFSLRMVSDVPVGVFLSSGVDSSLVSAILSKECGFDLNTFTIGFKEKNTDESEQARIISKILNTRHTESTLTVKEAKKIVTQLPTIWDEPFGDTSAIPTYLVSNLASKNVKVSLSADGADELFLGYNRYIQAFRRSYYSKIGLSENTYSFLNRHLPINQKLKREILRRLQMASSKNIYEYYLSIISEFGCRNLSQMYLNKVHLNNNFLHSKSLDYSKDITLTNFELKHYLEGDILCKVDRASMANSLESREPFLDQNVIKLALNLPFKNKINNGIGKVILKNLLEEYLPKESIYKNKQGFGIPVKEWMMSDFRDELYSFAIKSSKVNDPLSLSNYVLNFTKGNLKYSSRVWYFYVFELWKQHNNVTYDL